MFYGFAGWLLRVLFIFKMTHNKYPSGGKTDLMENTAMGRAKSNQAHPEKTAQLVGFLESCHLQMFPHPFTKSTTSRMWLNASQNVACDTVSPADLAPPCAQSQPGCNDQLSVQLKTPCRKTHKRHVSYAKGELTGHGHIGGFKEHLVIVDTPVPSLWRLVTRSLSFCCLIASLAFPLTSPI